MGLSPIMFHHFHQSGDIPHSPGSITARQLDEIIHYVGRDNILNAREYLKGAQEGTLKESDTCLTFDDGLESQYRVALPVLCKYGIKAFWHCPTGSYVGKPDPLEFLKVLQATYYVDQRVFMRDFIDCAQIHCKLTLKDGIQGVADSTLAICHASHVPFYSVLDRQFRYIRDVIIGDELIDIAKEMIERCGAEYSKLRDSLWMTPQQLKHLHALGHVVGLHTQSHHRNLDVASYDIQYQEFQSNKQDLCEILDCHDISTVAYPLGKFRRDVTEKVLKELGVSLGFTTRVGYAAKSANLFEHPRVDHVDVIAMMNVATAVNPHVPRILDRWLLSSEQIQKVVSLNSCMQHEFPEANFVITLDHDQLSNIYNVQFKDTNGFHGRRHVSLQDAYAAPSRRSNDPLVWITSEKAHEAASVMLNTSYPVTYILMFAASQSKFIHHESVFELSDSVETQRGKIRRLKEGGYGKLLVCALRTTT